jgi:hypothetical protein
MMGVARNLKTTRLAKFSRKLQRRGITISFMWIPGHVGIRGNEMVDAEAKEALSKPITDFDRISSDDLRAAVNRVCMQQWQELWNNIAGNKLRNIKLDTSAWPTSARNSRKEEVALTRLRIGHTVLPHAYLFTEEKQSPRCDSCECHLTARHVLEECTKYSLERRKLIGNQDIQTALGNNLDNINNVIQYIKNTGIIKHL